MFLAQMLLIISMSKLENISSQCVLCCPHSVTVQVCVDSVESALNAARGGASRLEVSLVTCQVSRVTCARCARRWRRAA